ncbi:hypothetical protein AB0F72_17615 [Actinoplanes sp. NPDC023936]|uniref:hypothetical protein n=1 Tax=Actinoplanes sp. NPDC023936 TaxID=3154910 RepID=UPI0033FD82E1
MPHDVTLPKEHATDILRMLTAFQAILKTGPLPENLWTAVGSAIGTDEFRYGTVISTQDLQKKVEEQLARLTRALGDQ